MTETGTHTSRRGGARNKTIVLLLLVVAVAAVWWFVHTRQASRADAAAAAKGGPPAAVGVATVEKRDVPLTLTALGTVTSTYTVTVHSRVDGQLDKVHFTEGQMVKPGQLLAELDPRPYRAALTQAQGQLQRDQALLRNAELDLNRYRQLLDQNSIAKQQVDTQDALVQQYRGTVKLDQGALDNAQLQYEYSRITAPVGGRVGLRQIDPGNIVHSGDAAGLVVITQTQPINVIFSLPEVSLAQVLEAMQRDSSLIVEAWDRDNRSKLTDGSLLAIDNQLNVATGTVNLKARFANGKQQLFPNQFVNVHLQLGARPDAVTVPTVALQLGSAGSYVYTVNADQTVSMSKVRLGPVSGDSTIIEQGLQPGQQVVIDGLDKLRQGAKVRVIDRVAQDKAAAAARPGTGRRHQRGGDTAPAAAPAAVPAK